MLIFLETVSASATPVSLYRILEKIFLSTFSLKVVRTNKAAMLFTNAAVSKFKRYMAGSQISFSYTRNSRSKSDVWLSIQIYQSLWSPEKAFLDNYKNPTWVRILMNKDHTKCWPTCCSDCDQNLNRTNVNVPLSKAPNIMKTFEHRWNYISWMQFSVFYLKMNSRRFIETGIKSKNILHLALICLILLFV